MAGAGLLRLVRRFMQTGRAIARCVNRIARQKLEGHDLGRLAPVGFDATLTNALVVQAVALTAALRERLFALAGRPLPALAPGVPKAERALRGRGTACCVTVTYDASADDRHDWVALAKPWRIGPGGVAVASQFIAGKSDRAVVTEICDYLRRAAEQLGAEADVGRIAALAAAARALCPDADAISEGAAGTAVPSSDAPWCARDDDPPLKRPDG